MQAEFNLQLRERDNALRQMGGRDFNNKAPSNNRVNDKKTCSQNSFENLNLNLNECGYKLKPDNFDGSVPLREFFTQFYLIARANGWSDSVKTIVLTSCLRGEAHSVFDGIFEIEDLKFDDLKSRLELRFGKGHLAQAYYTQFTNRKQKDSEDLAKLSADLERLSRLVYHDCTQEVRDKIVCTQFIAALSDGFIKRTLQLESITSLKLIIERAMAVKVLQENSFNNI